MSSNQSIMMHNKYQTRFDLFKMHDFFGFGLHYLIMSTAYSRAKKQASEIRADTALIFKEIDARDGLNHKHTDYPKFLADICFNLQNKTGICAWLIFPCILSLFAIALVGVNIFFDYGYCVPLAWYGLRIANSADGKTAIDNMIMKCGFQALNKIFGNVYGFKTIESNNDSLPVLERKLAYYVYIMMKVMPFLPKRKQIQIIVN